VSDFPGYSNTTKTSKQKNGESVGFRWKIPEKMKKTCCKMMDVRHFGLKRKPLGLAIASAEDQD